MKRFLVSILCTVLLLCSCNGNTTTAPVQTSETEETNPSAPETTAETTATEKTTVKEEPKEISLFDLPESRFGIKSFDFMCENEHKLVSGEPTRTPYGQSKSTINRRFCYTKQMTASITF